MAVRGLRSMKGIADLCIENSIESRRVGPCRPSAYYLRFVCGLSSIDDEPVVGDYANELFVLGTDEQGPKERS